MARIAAPPTAPLLNRVFTILLAAVVPGSSCNHREKPEVPVTAEAARATALERVPGEVREVELELENERWVWSVEIQPAIDRSGSLLEVDVDAHSGQISSVEPDPD